VKRISSFLIVAALIAAMVGCKATALPGCSLTITSNAGGSVTTPREGTFTCAEGSVINLVATPLSGYRFVNWTGDVGTMANVNAASTTITVNADYSIRANFEEIPGVQYILTISSTAGGSVTTPGEGTFTRNAGTAVSLVATPLSGYRFVNWTGDVGTIASAIGASTTVTMNDNYSITANFEETGVTYYTLTTSVSPSGGGSVSPTGGTYAAGSQVSLTATPASGYSFSNWGGDASGSQNPITITMNSNKSITAYFTTVWYTLTTSVSPSGGGSVSPAGGTYAAGSQVTLTATPASGYSFSNWGGDASGSQNPITITMDANYSITANFEVIPPVQYSLTISSTAGGSVTTPGEGSFTRNAGVVVSLVASPDTDYRFVYWTGDVGTIANVYAASTTITMSGNYEITANFEVSFMVAAGDLHTVGLESDGTVVAVGYNYYGQCNVGGWTNIIQVDAGGYHTVGLKSNGTVVAVGDNHYGQCNVGGWTNMVQVAAGGYHTVGIRSNGTVVAVGDNSYGQCNVGGWTNIVQVAADGGHTVGLKSNGTVVATGNNYWGQRDVSGWTNIVQVAAGDAHAVGLKSNGTVVATGNNYWGQCDVGGWTNIVQVAAGDAHTVGLRSNGTVFATGYNYHGQCNVSGWTNIIQVSASWEHTVGLRSDGTVVAVGWNEYGECDVGSWDLD